MDAHDGGWFFPLSLSNEHPLVVEEWVCFECGDEFDPSDVGMVMPLTGTDDQRWIATHRSCSLKSMGLPEIDDVTEVAAAIRRHRDQSDD